MKWLSDFLKNNPAINIFMFAFTLISSTVGLALGWKQFYSDYLSQSVTIPVWLVIFVVLLLFVGWVLYGARKKRSSDKPLTLIADRVFGVERVNASGKRFLGCQFHGTEIIIDGEGGFSLENCRFENQRFTFGGSAGIAIQALAAMYQDESFRPSIEATFEHIRRNSVRESPVPGISK